MSNIYIYKLQGTAPHCRESGFWTTHIVEELGAVFRDFCKRVLELFHKGSIRFSYGSS